MGPFKHTLSLCISSAREEDSKVGQNTVLHILRERKERNYREWSSWNKDCQKGSEKKKSYFIVITYK